MEKQLQQGLLLLLLKDEKDNHDVYVFIVTVW